MVPVPGARVVDVDVKETIGSGPRENIYDDSVVVAWELPTGFGAPELEIWGTRRGIGRDLHSGESEINPVVGAGAAAGKSSATDRHDPNPKLLNLVIFRFDTGRIRVRIRAPDCSSFAPPIDAHL